MNGEELDLSNPWQGKEEEDFPCEVCNTVELCLSTRECELEGDDD